MSEARICIGVVTGAQGVRGAVRVKSFTAVPADVASYGPVADESGQRRFSLRVVGEAKGVVVAKIAGVEDRNEAEALKGLRLYVERSALPAAGEEEYYHADLLGLTAVLRDGTVLGQVRAVHEYGAGDSIEVTRPSGVTVVVPFTRAAVPMVDLAGGRLVVDPPDGLLDNRPVEVAGEEEETSEEEETGE